MLLLDDIEASPPTSSVQRGLPPFFRRVHRCSKRQKLPDRLEVCLFCKDDSEVPLNNG